MICKEQCEHINAGLDKLPENDLLLEPLNGSANLFQGGEKLCTVSWVVLECAVKRPELVHEIAELIGRQAENSLRSGIQIGKDEIGRTVQRLLGVDKLIDALERSSAPL
jgi:hypothetical protein